MKPAYTFGMLALLAALLVYVFAFERHTPSGEINASPSAALANILSLEKTKVTGLEVHQNAPSKSVVLTKKGDVWQFEDGKPADAGRVDQVLSQLTPWQASAKLEEQFDSKQAADFGLEPAELIVQLKTAGGEKLLKVGHKTPVSSGYYVQLQGDPALYLSFVNVPEALRGLVTDPPVPKPSATPAAASPSPTGK